MHRPLAVSMSSPQLRLSSHQRQRARAPASLEILDATTLATIGALDIDTQAQINTRANGHLFIEIPGALLFIEIPGALLFVDVRDPTKPTARAAVPTRYKPQVIPYGDQIYISSGNVRAYPIDPQNLIP